MNRRSFLAGWVPLAAATPFVRFPDALASEPNRAPLTVTDLNDRLFVISGGGGNVTVFHSSDGVLLVDGGSPKRTAEILKLVRKRTGSSKVHTLFNTHWHWDQTGSNLRLGRAGTQIIAHENTRLWLTTDVDSKWQQRTFKRLPVEAQPNKTFYTSDQLSFSDESIEYGYLPQAHTDGDLYVIFKNANVLVAGDVISIGAYPIADYCTGGWIGGLLNATKTLGGLCNPETRVIPGSGPAQTRADLAAQETMLATLKPRLSELLAQGMSVQDMLAAAPTREFDAKWGDPRLFVTTAWPGLVHRSRELGVHIV